VSGSWKDKRSHRRKVAGTAKGKKEHSKRNVRRDRIPDDVDKKTWEEAQPAILDLPQGATVIYNSIYPSLPAKTRTQDECSVLLENGVCVDVGWYPDNDPLGEYSIHVFKDSWDNQLLDEPFCTKSPVEATDKVGEFARLFSKKKFEE